MKMNKALPKSTEEIRKCLKDFHSQELRRILYDIALEQREKGNLNKAIKVILLTWNWRAYAGSGVTDSQLDNQVNRFLENNKELIEHLKKENMGLRNINFNTKLKEESIGQYIVDNFNEFCKEKAIGSTGASKAFHMLHPKVFMMWDDRIVNQYHKKEAEPHWRKHKKGKGKCYLTFLKEIQKFIKKKLDSNKFPDKDPTKIMDEYNYAKYTLPEIRG